MKRWILSLAVFFVATLLCVPIAFFAVLYFAGPHAGLVPEWVEKIILLAGWLFTITVPIYLARKTYKITR